MNSRERFYYMKKNFPNTFNLKAEEVIKILVNFLINGLYIPSKGETIKEVDKNRLKRFNISNDEPINWWDLECKEVEMINNDNFLVKVEEAGKNACKTFCHYIENYMISYGWVCHVETEW
jgi:hypothetical protein